MSNPVDEAVPAGPDGQPDRPAPAPPPTPPTPLTLNDQRAAFIRLLLFVAAATFVSVAAGVGKTVAVVLAILLMIVLHEFGHFVMAKLAGIKVTEFFVGFGTRLWSVRRGETEYGVKALPLGGYVKIIGMSNIEQVDPADEARTYRQKPFWRRISVAVAGSAMHFLIALVLLFTVFFFVGDRGRFVLPAANQVRVAAIETLNTGPSPAQQAGFRIGDRILAIDGRTFKSFGDQVAYIQARPNQTLDVTVERHSQLLHLHPTTVDLSKVQVQGVPAGVLPAADHPTGFIGFSGSDPTIRLGLFQSISKTGGFFVDLSARTFDALGSLASTHGISSYGHMLVDQKAANSPSNGVRFSSPVGIVRLANTAAGNGIEDVLFLLILINIFVGIFNMLPLLPLDGGHVAIAVYEAARSRKGQPYHADVAKLMPVVYAALALIVFIGVSSLFLDLRDVLSVIRL